MPPSEESAPATGISGIGGLSTVPLLILTIIAFALPLMTLLFSLVISSVSPSKTLFTRIATISSAERFTAMLPALLGTLETSDKLLSLKTTFGTISFKRLKI